MKHQNKGFTLIELLITVALIGIVAAIGLPSFRSLIESNQLTSSANAMVSALQLARFEALKHRGIVVVRRNVSNWKDGWRVFIDKDKSHTLTGSEEVFAVFDKLSPSITITPVSSYTNYVEYDATGRANIGGSFCFSASTQYRKVVVASTGRIRVEIPSSC